MSPPSGREAVYPRAPGESFGARAVLWDCGHLPEYIARLKEAPDFLGGGSGAIRGVADVEHFVPTEVATNSALGGLRGVGGAEEVADAVDGAFTAEDEDDHGARAHEADDVGKEGEFGEVGVMLAQKGVGQTEHFAGNDVKASAFKAVDDLSGQVLVEGIGLEDDEGLFQGHRRKRSLDRKSGGLSSL